MRWELGQTPLTNGKMRTTSKYAQEKNKGMEARRKGDGGHLTGSHGRHGGGGG